MIKLEKLYSEPEIFDPIQFDYGLNIIMGEKSELSKKKIGVGKTICIEFLNFCLLKDFSHSRLALIPKGIVPSETKIKLDLKFNNYNLTIIRTFGDKNSVQIFKDGEEIFFDKVADASNYLADLYFEHYAASCKRISFTNLLYPIIRDERSEFKDIIQCFDTTLRIPRDFKPHLFYFGLYNDLFSSINETLKTLEKKKKYSTETKKEIVKISGNIKDAKAKLNELESEVSKINTSIEQLKSNDSFEVIQADINNLEKSLSELRVKQKAINYEIKKIESLPKPEHISENELTIIFNQFKKGLGNMVEKSIEELKTFKSKIDNFRNTLVNTRLESLKSELFIINEKVRELDNACSDKIKLLDSNGLFLKDLRTSIKVLETKSRELSHLKTLIDMYDLVEREKKTLRNQTSNFTTSLDDFILENQKIIKSFENTILDIHEKIMDSREASFGITTTSNKEFVIFNLKIADKGSHSTNRMQVFIYDLALLFNEYTKLKHPKFLIHDNIFQVDDDDSLCKSLNFLYKESLNSLNEFQYIVTINSDLIDSLMSQELLEFNPYEYKKAGFTKANRFLKTDKYDENDSTPKSKAF
jgi:uncharacterized protein YydD (DUF2326 family)